MTFLIQNDPFDPQKSFGQHFSLFGPFGHLGPLGLFVRFGNFSQFGCLGHLDHGTWDQNDPI